MAIHFRFPLPFCPLLSAIHLFEYNVFLLLSIYLLRFIKVLLFLQATETDYSNVGSMIECGLFIEALDSIRNAVFPGLVPPAPNLVSLLEYAQQVGPEHPECTNSHQLLQEPQGLHKSITCLLNFLTFVRCVLYIFNCIQTSQTLFVVCFIMSQGHATSFFLRNLRKVMYNLLITNPPWMAHCKVRKYFSQVLQCPRCKAGLWPFLETAIRYTS